MPLAITIWLHSLSIVVAAYLLGSIPTGYLLMRFVRKQDIRTLGSGNIGATNVLRSGAKGLGVATFGLDVLKGALAVLLGGWLSTLGTPHLILHQAQALAALCAVLGHIFPIWLGLRGGKGVATAFGVFLVLAPLPAACCLVLFVLVFAISRYVSLASLLGAVAFPVFAWYLAPWSRSGPVLAVMLLIPAIVIVKHHQNIQRLLKGTEYRFGKKKPAAKVEDPA